MPWVPEAFHARLSSFGQTLKSRRRVGLGPTKLLVAREKKPLVPRVGRYNAKSGKTQVNEVGGHITEDQQANKPHVGRNPGNSVD